MSWALSMALRYNHFIPPGLKAIPNNPSPANQMTYTPKYSNWKAMGQKKLMTRKNGKNPSAPQSHMQTVMRQPISAAKDEKK